MLEGKDGVYYLRSGSILTAGRFTYLDRKAGCMLILREGFWRLEDELGMSLDDIHLSGNVPQCEFL